jgi:hypothetical protein
MAWSWIWPDVGANSINQTLDSEMFDRDDYPYSETFVREAIQNSLDARLDKSKPVRIRFQFHEDRLGRRASYLKGLIDLRIRAGLRVPAAWDSNSIRWVTVQDFNAKGLLGPLGSRTSDFWNYWLNFGLSNKDASQRGGRGIGRVTFLIASQIRAVIGITRPFNDQRVVACGMGVLKAGEYGSDFKSTHGYLAERENGYIYDLHTSDDFYRDLEDLFALESYTKDKSLTGLALLIPYPHDDLTVDKVVSAAVDHFAPAILSGSLIVEADEYVLDSQTIEEFAPFFATDVVSKGIAGDLGRYLRLIRAGL